jgi:hypothetical protein
MQQEFKNSFGKTFLSIEHDVGRNWLYNNWQGLLSTAAVMQGCTGVLRVLEATHCPYVLNDNRAVIGSWQQANDWIEREWMPKALAAGMHRFAHIVAPGVFGQASAEEMHLRVGSRFEMQLFQDMETARQWLLQSQSVAQTA